MVARLHTPRSGSRTFGALVTAATLTLGLVVGLPAAGLATPADSSDAAAEKAAAEIQAARDRANAAADAAFAVFLTQDAVLAQPDAIARLLSAFADPQVAAVYGRQLPHPGADPVSAHARGFNYPGVSRTVTLADRAALGIRTCFLSNA